MSYSPKGADNWIAEQRAEIERQHNEITELNGRLKDALEERDELAKVVEAQAFDLKDHSRALDELSEAVSSAISDLRVLGEVPLGELEDAVKAIADRLADKNGELY
ncbi:hypothetical protein ACWEF6_01720 [Amycolatopsis sp. NPDC004772]